MSEDKFDFALVRVKFKEIRPDNLNPRHQREPEADQTLKRLIDTHGTIDMMWICKDPDGHFRLLDGHRRYDVRVEEGYIDNNPTVTCVILLAKDDPDRTLTEEEITLWRILRERGKEKWKDFDFYLKAVEHADSQKEKGRNYFSIAREDFDWSPDYLSKVKSVLDDPILSNFLGRATISMHDATRLLNLPAETQKDLIERRDDLSACELRETVKLVRKGMETASAIESVKQPKEEIPEPSEDDPRTVLINSISEDLRERFTKDTKDFNVRDIERIVKLIEHGVVMHDAIRTVKLSQTETPEKTEKGEGELPVHDGEGGSTEEALLSPETDDIISKAFERGGEKGTEDAVLEEDDTSPDAMLTTQSPLPEEEVEVTPGSDPSPETEKKKEPQVCVKVGQVEEMLQKYVKIPPKTFLSKFKTVSHKGNFKNRVEGIHLWSGELSDLMESDLNSDSLFVCEVKRKRKALMDILARSKHSIIESEREKFNDLMNELKTKIEQVAERGG